LSETVAQQMHRRLAGQPVEQGKCASDTKGPCGIRELTEHDANNEQDEDQRNRHVSVTTDACGDQRGKRSTGECADETFSAANEYIAA